MAKMIQANNTTSTNSDKPKAKVWVNVGVMQPKSNGEGEYLLSAGGIAVDTAKPTGKLQKQLIAAILEKENAVEDFRALIGATNPAEAAEGTIRKLYATSIGENAVHGSDSDENAAIEGAFHFAGRDMF